MTDIMNWTAPRGWGLPLKRINPGFYLGLVWLPETSPLVRLGPDHVPGLPAFVETDEVMRPGCVTWATKVDADALAKAQIQLEAIARRLVALEDGLVDVRLRS